MNDLIDVKNIFDIPNFEKYADKMFEFRLYDEADNVVVYFYNDSQNDINVSVEIISDTVKQLFSEEQLLEIATMDNILFFQMNFINEGVITKESFDIEKAKEIMIGMMQGSRTSYAFRPLIKESEKTYLK